MTKHKSKKAKLEKSRAWGEQEEKPSIVPANATAYGDQLQSSSRPAFEKISFIPEVTAMLYAYGDVRRPLAETAAIVEEIIKSQMCQLLKATAEIALLRSSYKLGLEEFIFLLRRNEGKLSRFVKRMKFLDSHGKFVRTSAASEDDSGSQEEMLAGEATLKGLKRWKICIEFLTDIDESGDLLRAVTESTEDDVKVKRMERAEQQTRNMTSEEYMEYVKCRQISFISNKGSGKRKFRDWFDFDKLNIDVRPTSYGWEALEYLAQETVSELVDYSLLVRSENIPPLLPCEAEPDSRHLPLYASSSLLDRAEVLSSAAGSAKAKSDEATIEGETGPFVKKNDHDSVNLNRKLALTAAHVREAMRRFNSGDTRAFLSRTITTSNENTTAKLLCLV